MTVRALLWAPAWSPEGGHRVQLTKTLEALDAGGRVKAWTSSDPEVPFDGADVVHGFGLTPIQARRVRLAGKRLVLSTIYCSKSYRQRGLLPLPRSQESVWRVRATAGMALAALRGRAHEKAEQVASWVTETRALYELADLLLPNSEAEARTVQEELHVTTPRHVVPNAVDAKVFLSQGGLSRDGAIMVGRIEPHKNQLRLMRVCRSLGTPLTVVGDPHPHHQAYYRACQRLTGRGIQMLPRVEHRRLSASYQRARVHALPSYFETTGLVSLEAALSGCAIVTTARGYARDYFGELADYCEPHDEGSIATALTRALDRSADSAETERLKERILSRFTWEHTASATADAYERVMG